MGVAMPEPDVWVHPAVAVGASRIAGQGLVATESISAGTVVIRLGGRLVSTAELHRLFDDAGLDGGYVDTVTVEADVHLVLPGGTVAHFANHSCDPAMWHVGPYEIAARRHVDAGDELTIDYGTHSGDEMFRMDCECGTGLCRGVVTALDWRRPELRERYLGHWVPALAALIERHG